MTFDLARPQEYIIVNIITMMKYILEASLGVDQPLWSSLGANRNSIKPIGLGFTLSNKKACLFFLAMIS